MRLNWGTGLLLAATLAIAGERPTPPPGWRVSQRLQAGWEHDSNVLEALRGPAAAEDLRLLYEIRLSRRQGTAASQLAYRGGGQFYSGVAGENKVIQEAEGSLRIAVKPRLQLGVQGWGRAKLFLQRDDDYLFGRGQLHLTTLLTDHLSLKGGMTFEGLGYASTHFYNYSAPGGYLQLQQQIGGRLILVAHLSRQEMKFHRVASTVITQNENLPASGVRQHDRLSGGGLRLEAAWPSLLMQIGFRSETNGSNSYGYDYGRHILEASFVRQFGLICLRGLVTLQQKNYRDNLYPFWPLQLDTEREENNFILLDLSRPVYQGIELLLRAAWYRNESPWANLYYQKQLISLSLEYRR